MIKHAKLQNVYLTQTIYRFLLGYFEQHHFLIKTVVATFLAAF